MTATDTSGIRVKGLTKAYRGKRVVDDVSFTAQPGCITALLGPNGSGKSTTLRAMVGLTRADSGSVDFFGIRFHDLESPARTVGISLDASAQHAGRSVWETARLAGLAGGVSRESVSESLARVGLDSVRNRKVGALSLGMRQRLGLSIALLGSPRCLLLDEPGNGLDPDGMSWLYALLVDFAQEGGVVLLSSHHLRDLDAIADYVVILDRGRTVYSGPTTQLQAVKTSVRSVDDLGLRAALESAGLRCHAGSHGIEVAADPETIGRLALSSGIALVELAGHRTDLEELFLSSTSGEFSSKPLASRSRNTVR